MGGLEKLQIKRIEREFEKNAGKQPGDCNKWKLCGEIVPFSFSGRLDVHLNKI